MNMLRTILIVGSLAGTTILPAQSAFVRQTDLATGQIYDTAIAATSGGGYTAPVRVNESGSQYQLFASGTAWDTNIYLLDTKIIGAYNPVGSVAITTEDSYVRGDPTTGTYVRRTRADRPFSADIAVSGLLSNSASTAQNRVNFSIMGTNYNQTSYSGLGQTPYQIYASDIPNGSIHLGPSLHQLTSPTISTGCGSQTYTIMRYAGYGVPNTALVSPSVEIWPVATAAATVLTSGSVFIDRIPTVALTLSHLYPDSRTYAQIYSGPAVLGTAGTLITGTERLIGLYYNSNQVAVPTNVPQDYTISIANLSTYAATDGTYTFEVITQTPFFGRTGERLLSITFQVDRVISSRAQISSAEKTSP